MKCADLPRRLFQVLSTTSHRRPRRCHLTIEGLEGRLLMANLGTLAPSKPSAQVDFYVAKNGSNSNPGTLSQPFLTIAKGVSVLAPGDTLFVETGTYTESFQGTIPGGTSWSNPVTIEAYPGNNVTIQPNRGAARVMTFSGSNEQYIIIKGFTLNAKNVTYDAVKITDSSSRGPASHIELANCTVENARDNGILTTDGAGYNQFIDLNVHNNGLTRFRNGLYLATPNNIVDGCIVYSNSGTGISIYSEASTTDCDNNIVSNNMSYNNGVATSTLAFGIDIASGTGIQVFNNVCYGNYDGGIQVDYWSPTNCKIVNNTCVGNNSQGIYVGNGVDGGEGGPAVGTLVENNICYNNAQGDFYDTGTATSQVTNLFGVNPQFVNAAADNFHLQSGSPAIGAGTSIGVPTTDINGNTRPQGRYDIGAYEYVSA